MNNYWSNPLMNQPQQFYQPIAPRYDIITVNGEAGAKNFKMAPNSKAALIDETAPIVWLAQTDGTGYLTVTPYDIVPHQQPVQVNVNDLEARVRKLEEQYVQQSNTSTNKPRKQQQRREEPITDKESSIANQTGI